MALRHKSMFLYNFEVTPLNSSLDFRAVFGGPVLMATLQLGYYSLSALGDEIARALKAADPTRTYYTSIDRTVGGGLENRLSISTSGTFLSLLFGTGPRIGSSCAYLIGFDPVDLSGLTLYQGSHTAGTSLITEYVGYNYLSPIMYRKVFGASNVSANGDKESVVFQIQRFIQVEYRHEPQSKVESQWYPFVDWAIQQRLFEITPDISSPLEYYEVTLEKTEADGKGLAWRFREELPNFAFRYTTGSITMRVRPPQVAFI